MTHVLIAVGVTLGACDRPAPAPEDAGAAESVPFDGRADRDEVIVARGCVTGTASVGSSVTCASGDPARDCIGHLCIQVFDVSGSPPPAAPIGTRCMPSVDLGAHPPYVATFDLTRAPPGQWIWVSAWLAEANPAQPPVGPQHGDLWLDAPISVTSSASCLVVPIVLDARN